MTNITKHPTTLQAETDAMKDLLCSAHRAVCKGEDLLRAIERSLLQAKQFHAAGRKRQSREVLDETLTIIREHLLTGGYSEVHAAMAALGTETGNGRA
ncbi:hypothetical protein ACFFP0_00740 [Rhizobium puerariae]|uniref:Uncharacterized protein n=1 Tax=Rhizobium puerariae TaxID=1585791 RepID=A0ABV6ADA4_9HYPH